MSVSLCTARQNRPFKPKLQLILINGQGAYVLPQAFASYELRLYRLNNGTPFAVGTVANGKIAIAAVVGATEVTLNFPSTDMANLSGYGSMELISTVAGSVPVAVPPLMFVNEATPYSIEDGQKITIFNETVVCVIANDVLQQQLSSVGVAVNVGIPGSPASGSFAGNQLTLNVPASGLQKLDFFGGLAVASRRLVPSGVGITPSRYRSFTTVATKQYEAVVIAHKDQMANLQILNAAAAASGGMSAFFDLANGTVRSIVGTASITALGGGWYQCLAQCAIVTAGVSNNIQLRPSVAGIFPISPNGTDGLFVESFIYREVGTTINLFPSSDVTDAGTFSNVACGTATGSVSEVLESTANVRAQKQADTTDTVLFGRQIASRLTEGSGAGLQTRIYKNTGIPAVIGDTITFKARMKRGLRKRVNFVCNTMANFDVTFDLETGTAIGTGGSIKYMSGGYWELTATATAIAASTTNMQIRVYDDTGATPRTGNGTGYVSIYDATLLFNGAIIWSDTSFATGWTLDGITLTSNADMFGNAALDLVPENASALHSFNGKKVGILGTSITIQGFYTTPLIEKTGAIVQNLGLSGACLASSAAAGSLVITTQIGSLDVASDYVLLEAGTNDVADSASLLGAIGDTTTATFYGALYNAEVAIRARCPSAKIAFLTPYSADSSYSGGRRHFYTNSNGNTLRQFQNAVVDVAALLGLPLIDVGREAGIGYHTPTLFSDGLHINAAGGAIFSKYLTGRTRRIAEMGVF
jgi:lysophospholipase L1-like esterase